MPKWFDETPPNPADEYLRQLNKLTKEKESSDLSKTFMKIGLLVLSIPFLFVYGVWANALVGKTLWAWFVVKTFGLPALTMCQAWGLSILISMWTYQHFTHYDKDERSATEKVCEIVGVALRPWAILFVGWLALKVGGL